MYDKRLEQGMKNLKAIDGEAGNVSSRRWKGSPQMLAATFWNLPLGIFMKKILFPLENGRSSPLQVC